MDKEKTKADTELLKESIAKKQQNMLINGSKFSVLVILQGMDASGKDGIIRDVFSGLNPATCSVFSFKKPSEEEMQHDYLWRIHQQVPPLGHIRVFNRSHYEEVLVQRVHKWVDETTIEQRYHQINAFEKYLTENHIRIVKCMLHVSKEKQLERLTERENDPKEHYKFNPSDMKERAYWDEYMESYQLAIDHCNEVPWHIIPSDHNWYKNYLIAQLVNKSMS